MNALKLKTLALVALLLLAPLHAFAQTDDEAFRKGNRAYEQGQKTEAVKHYTQAIELNPQDADAYYNRGNAKLALGDQPWTIQDFTRAIELNPQFAIAYCNRGIVKAQSGDKRGAFVDLEKAKQLFVEQGNMEAYKNAIEIQKKVSDQFARKGQ
jgi:tetratricopeptide (TPR) repeat protein